MSDVDVIALLAEANPVLADELAPIGFPALVRRSPARRIALAVALVIAVLGATLVGIFAFGGNSKSTGRVMPAIPPGFAPLADASKILGFPVVLPDTALVNPSDAAKTVETVCVPKDDTVDPGAGGCQVRVSFPTAGLTVTYFTFPGMRSLQDSYEQIVQDNSGAELVSVGGVQALYVPQQESLIEFDLGGTQISVEGAYGKETLESVAQSIVDRSPVSPPTQVTGPAGPTGWAGPVTVAHPLGNGPKITLAEAAAAIGQPVVLPHTSLLGPGDVGAVFAWSHDVRGIVAVTYPAQVLYVEYSEPAPFADPAHVYAVMAKETVPGSKVIELSGRPAIVIHGNDSITGTNPYTVMFQINGLEISVVGEQDKARLESIAKSIIDRSPRSRRKPPGFNLLPALALKRVALRTASRRLGTAIPLPGLRFLKRSTAGEGWESGHCPPSGRRACMILIPFPAESVSLIYQRPGLGWPRTRAQYEVEAKHMRKGEAEVIDLGGVPALAIDENIAGQHNPGSIAFVVAGTRVVVAGRRSTEALRAIAQSIVDRSK